MLKHTLSTISFQISFILLKPSLLKYCVLQCFSVHFFITVFSALTVNMTFSINVIFIHFAVLEILIIEYALRFNHVLKTKYT